MGRVSGGVLEILAPHRFRPSDGVQLTTTAIEEGGDPHAGYVDIRPYEAGIIFVSGQKSGKWIFSATIRETVPQESLLAMVTEHALGKQIDHLARRVEALERSVSVMVSSLEESLRALTSPSNPMSYFDCGDWAAFYARDGRSVLEVKGRCSFPTAGYQARLQGREPQTLPRTLLLDLVVSEPSGPVSQAVTDVQLHYEEPFGGADQPWEEVIILPDGPILGIVR